MAKKRSKVVTIESVYGNYSEFIKQRFEELSISPGDLIKINQDAKTVEGNLIAQNELGDPQTIIMKLDNGYNIGVSVDESVEIKKLVGSVSLASFNIRVPEQKDGLPDISLIATL